MSNSPFGNPVKKSEESKNTKDDHLSSKDKVMNDDLPNDPDGVTFAEGTDWEIDGLALTYLKATPTDYIIEYLRTRVNDDVSRIMLDKISEDMEALKEKSPETLSEALNDAFIKRFETKLHAIKSKG